MDLSFRLPDPAAAAELSEPDMALLIATLAQHQAASATAQVQAVIGAAHDADGALATLLAPADGTFNTAMAARIADWQQE